MASIWIKSQYPGVRYREHAKRKAPNGQLDRYFTIRMKRNGKLIEEALGWSTEGWNAEKAYNVLAELKKGVKTGEGPKTLAEKRELAEKQKAKEEEQAKIERNKYMTLEVFWENHFIPRIKKEKRSWLTDLQRIEKIKKMIPSLSKLPLCSVTPNHIQKLVDIMEDNEFEPSTIIQYFGILRRTFNVAKDTKVDGIFLFTGKNPASKNDELILPVINNERERFLTVEEADILIKESKKFRSIDLHDVIVLSLNTGLRLGELTRLEWSYVDLHNGFVTVKKEKNRKTGGVVPLNKDAMEIFKARLQNRKDSHLVFPPVYGDNLRMNLTHNFAKLVRNVGLNKNIDDKDRKHKIVFHSLRHTFASWLAINGTDIYRIQKLMRHKSITMTMRYAHLLPDATRNAVENLRPTAIKRT